ncbi:MAG: DUF4198 domain-containing protein [Firmicutes bacterium]|nr:DUF4198 domain-containing protein [Bacillota bacterium]
MTNRRVLWLLPVHLHFHAGHDVEVMVFCGVAMKSAGTVPDVTATVAFPDGKLLQLEAGREGEVGYIRFPAGDEGLYTLTAETGGNTARLLVQVGHHVHGEGKPGGKGMEIVPLHYREYHLQDTIEMQVLLDGCPVEGAVVSAVSHLQEGTDYSHRMKAGEGGMVRFTFPGKGHWLFVAESPGAVSGDRFATLVVPGVR